MSGKMMIQEIRSGNEEVDAYIAGLEEFLLNLEAGNIYKLIKECDNASGTLADDVRLLVEEDDDEVLEKRLVMLGSRRNKRFEAFLALVRTMKDLKGIADMVEGMKPKKAVKQDKNEASVKADVVEEPKKRKNIQDFANGTG